MANQQLNTVALSCSNAVFGAISGAEADIVEGITEVAESGLICVKREVYGGKVTVVRNIVVEEYAGRGKRRKVL